MEGGFENRALYSVREVGQVLTLGKTKIYELVDSGILESVKIGRATRITRFSLVRYLISLGALAVPRERVVLEPMSVADDQAASSRKGVAEKSSALRVRRGKAAV